MEYTAINKEYIRLREEVDNLQSELMKTAVKVAIEKDTVYPLSIPLALRKTTTTHKNRENREKQKNEEALETLRAYFKENNMMSEMFDPTPYEVPHSDSFEDMLEDVEED